MNWLNHVVRLLRETSSDFISQDFAISNCMLLFGVFFVWFFVVVFCVVFMCKKKPEIYDVILNSSYLSDLYMIQLIRSH